MLPLTGAPSKLMLSQKSDDERRRRRKRKSMKRKPQHTGAAQLVNSLRQSKLVLFMCSGVVLTLVLALFSDVPAFRRGDVLHRITNTSLSTSFKWMAQLKRMAHRLRRTHHTKQQQSKSIQVANTFQLDLQGSLHVHTPSSSMTKAANISSLSYRPYYNNLKITLLDNNKNNNAGTSSSFTRRITDFAATGPVYKSPDKQAFYAQDDAFEITNNLDDFNPRRQQARGQAYREGRRLCRYPQARNHHRPMCNPFHELGLEARVRSGHADWVGEGSYREVYVINKHNTNDTTRNDNHNTNNHDEETFVFKEMGMDGNEFFYHRMEEYLFEGLVSEITTPHELYAEMYGFCAFSIFGEYFNKGSVEDFSVYKDRCEQDIEWGDEFPLVSQNNLTALQKVEYALNMAESVALLHNNPFGVLIHNDIQLSQFLLAADGKSLKFNDFNRADILMYDEENKEFCKYRNGPGQGDWRSPEEYEDGLLDEAIDIFSLGNSYYSILTGLYPFPNICKYENIQKSVKKGKRSYLDPRWKNKSPGEAMLLEVIEKCWEQDPANRPSAGDLVRSLRAALEEQKHVDHIGP